MQLDDRLKAFLQLGVYLRSFGKSEVTPPELENLEAAARRAERINPWFTYAHNVQAINSLGDMLQAKALERWVQMYPRLSEKHVPKTVGVVMAGNIPLVGFHDMLCILLSGNRMLAKLSSKDEVLPKAVVALLTEIEPRFASLIALEVGLMKNFDAIIATGSDNSARYFDYYFKKYPHIIRGNRNSVAIVKGDESVEELRLLAKDIFLYFGLGCRNVSKLYLPKGFDVNRFFEATADFEYMAQHTKYMNNFDYQQAVLIISQIRIESNGFTVLREYEALKSAISVTNYEYYTDLKAVHAALEAMRDDIQCIVGKRDSHPEALPFGTSQTPALWDYADNVDTMAFLMGLNAETA